MIALYLLAAAIAIMLYMSTYKLDRKKRLLIAVVVFFVLSFAMTCYVFIAIEDRPPPGAIRVLP